MRIQTNGLSLNVLDEGEGDPILLLHGFPDSSRLWRYQIPSLAEAGYRVIAPDLRGFGESDKPAQVEAYTLQTLIEDVVAVLNALQVERASVVAHDLGTVLAWTLAALRPERVQRLVALTKGHPSGFRSHLQLAKSHYLRFFQQPEAEDALRRDGWKLMRELGASHPDLQQVLADLDQPGALTAGMNWYRALARPKQFGHGQPASLPAVSCPVLGVWASEDAYLCEEQMLASAAYVEGPWRYERLDGVGHWIPLQVPHRLTMLLLEFLRAPLDAGAAAAEGAGHRTRANGSPR
jgi:pimeloyl-ACP methyl ester carboxylesterase